MTKYDNLFLLSNIIGNNINLAQDSFLNINDDALENRTEAQLIS